MPNQYRDPDEFTDDDFPEVRIARVESPNGGEAQAAPYWPDGKPLYLSNPDGSLNPPAFASLPGEFRYDLRSKLEALGCEVCSYSGPSVQVSIYRLHASDVVSGAAKLGLVLVPGSLNYYPLVSDKPAAELRHRGPYQTEADAPGYWLRAAFSLDPARNWPAPEFSFLAGRA